MIICLFVWQSITALILRSFLIIGLMLPSYFGHEHCNLFEYLDMQFSSLDPFSHSSYTKLRPLITSILLKFVVLVNLLGRGIYAQQVAF